MRELQIRYFCDSHFHLLRQHFDEDVETFNVSTGSGTYEIELCKGCAQGLLGPLNELIRLTDNPKKSRGDRNRKESVAEGSTTSAPALPNTDSMQIGYSCILCEEIRDSTYARLSTHMKNVHGKDIKNLFRQKCFVCGSTVATPASLRHHMTYHTDIPVSSVTLTQKFLYVRDIMKDPGGYCQELTDSLLLNLPPDNLPHITAPIKYCLFCDYAHHNKDSIRRHYKVIHDVTTSQLYGLQCAVCGREFDELTQLRGHFVCTHNELGSLSASLAWARDNGDPHGVYERQVKLVGGGNGVRPEQ